MYGCESESWTLKAADRRRLAAFEMTAYRKILCISWTVYRTNMFKPTNGGHCIITVTVEI